MRRSFKPRQNAAQNKDLPADLSGSAVAMIMLFVLAAVALGFAIWGVVATQQSTAIDTSSNYLPIVNSVVLPNIVDIKNSYTPNPYGTFQYVYVIRGDEQIDSDQTPRTTLPVFNPQLFTVTFNISSFEENDKIIHAFYLTSNTQDSQTPIQSDCYVFKTLYLNDFSGAPICFENGDYCRYPLEIFDGPTPVVTLNNEYELLKWLQENVYSSTFINDATGAISLLQPCNSELIVSNLTVLENAVESAFTVQLNSQAGNRQFTLCFVDYDVDPTLYYIAFPKDIYTSVIVDYNDGSSPQQISGFYGTSNPIVYTYSVSAPPLVNVTIKGFMPSFSCAIMGDQIAYNPMITDVVNWGDVSIQKADFYYESGMLRFTAGSPPPTLTHSWYLFPGAVGADPNVWSNLNTWDWSNFIELIGAFYQIETGVLDLRGMVLENVRRADDMFDGVKVPIIGNLTDLRMPNVESIVAMFGLYNGGPINITQLQLSNVVNFSVLFADYRGNEQDVSNWDTGSAKLLKQMFFHTASFPNLNISAWDTKNVTDVEQFAYGCEGIKPVFTNWDLSSVINCNEMITNSTPFDLDNIGISIDADYDQILIDWESKTQSTGLICDWSPFPGINGLASTPEGQAARTALINRGWSIRDLAGLN